MFLKKIGILLCICNFISASQPSDKAQAEINRRSKHVIKSAAYAAGAKNSAIMPIAVAGVALGTTAIIYGANELFLPGSKKEYERNLQFCHGFAALACCTTVTCCCIGCKSAKYCYKKAASHYTQSTMSEDDFKT